MSYLDEAQRRTLTEVARRAPDQGMVAETGFPIRPEESQDFEFRDHALFQDQTGKYMWADSTWDPSASEGG